MSHLCVTDWPTIWWISLHNRFFEPLAIDLKCKDLVEYVLSFIITKLPVIPSWHALLNDLS